MWFKLLKKKDANQSSWYLIQPTHFIRTILGSCSQPRSKLHLLAMVWITVVPPKSNRVRDASWALRTVQRAGLVSDYPNRRRERSTRQSHARRELLPRIGMTKIDNHCLELELPLAAAAAAFSQAPSDCTKPIMNGHYQQWLCINIQYNKSTVYGRSVVIIAIAGIRLNRCCCCYISHSCIGYMAFRRRLRWQIHWTVKKDNDDDADYNKVEIKRRNGFRCLDSIWTMWTHLFPLQPAISILLFGLVVWGKNVNNFSVYPFHR